MVKISKIYTRTGDDGSTGLVGGERTVKDSLRVESYGDIDELNSYLGWARTAASVFEALNPLSAKFAVLQNELFDIGAELATPAGKETKGMHKLAEQQVSRLENWIDELISGLPALKSFVLPGGSELNSILHVGRCVCRRAERNILRLSRQESVSPVIIRYVNRLSDLLFAMARFEANQSGREEFLWQPAQTKAL